MTSAFARVWAAAPVTLALLSFAPPASAQVERPGALVADLGLHVVAVGYQRTLSPRLALQASTGLYGPWTVNDNVLGNGGGDHDPPGDVIGAMLRARAFVFILGDAPGGLWLSPFAQVGLVTATVRGEAALGPAWAAGASVGYTFRLGPRWLLALGLGAQYHVAAPGGGASFPGFARVSPTVDINVGYAL